MGISLILQKRPNDMTQKKENMIPYDPAFALGLSKSTVSRAISGKGRVGGQTRKRVLEYAQKQGYAPNGIASSLARSRTNSIGVAIPAEAFCGEAPFFQECLAGVCEAAARRISSKVRACRSSPSARRRMRPSCRLTRTPPPPHAARSLRKRCRTAACASR